MKVVGHIEVTSSAILLNGVRMSVKGSGLSLLKSVYQEYIGGYPKYYKMDTLSRLGFVASEILLQQDREGEEVTEKGAADGQAHEAVDREDRAVVIFGKHGSSNSDRSFQETLDAHDEFFPSPAAFVYTLPNIVAGEIAIRHHYIGETNYIALPEKNVELMMQMVQQTLTDDLTTSVVCGWLDVMDACHFEGELWLIEQD